MLSPEVTMTTDGGGKVQAARNVLLGQTNVARFIFGILGKLPLGSRMSARLAEVNGQPGILTYVDGELNSVLSLDCVGDQIVAINGVMNPDKLASFAGTS
jgi:RNA polymerase sigma-70 factor, ECF subfamily